MKRPLGKIINAETFLFQRLRYSNALRYRFFLFSKSVRTVRRAFQDTGVHAEDLTKRRASSNVESSVAQAIKFQVQTKSISTRPFEFKDGSPKKMKCLGKPNEAKFWKVRPATQGHVIQCVRK